MTGRVNTIVTKRVVEVTEQEVVLTLSEKEAQYLKRMLIQLTTGVDPAWNSERTYTVPIAVAPDSYYSTFVIGPLITALVCVDIPKVC